MKKYLSAVIVLFILACNNNNGEGSTANNDTANHTVHQSTDGTIYNAAVDTTAVAGQTMMSLMKQNMADMQAIQSTGNPDNDFAALMKTHHLGAVQMAQLQIARGTDPQIKSMAQKMLNEQQKEIAALNTFLSGHQAHGGGDAFHKQVMSSMKNMKMDMDHAATIDKQFVQMMILHHQGAIDMANAYIKSGAHEEQLKAMAAKMIKDQQKEIEELKGWLTKNQ